MTGWSVPKWAVPVGVAVLVLVAAGLIFDWLKPGGSVTKSEKTVAESRLEESTQLNRQLAETARGALTENEALERQLAEQERRLANLTSETSREIIRYLPGQTQTIPIPIPTGAATPATPGAPSVVVVPGAKDPLPPQLLAQGFTPGQVIEIIRETSKSEDRSVTERGKTETEKSSGESTATSETTKLETTKETTEKKEESKVTTEKKETRRANGGGGGRLGVGVTSGADPFLSYDLKQFDLGPKPLGLGKLGAGLFVTGDVSGLSGGGSKSFGDRLDFGPQLNVQPGKGRLFLMGGYGVRQKKTIIGVGMKW